VKHPLPPFAELKKLLEYNPETGVFTWKVDVAKNRKAGMVAGGKVGTYWFISINGCGYYAQRLAWLFAHGVDPGENNVDHIDRNKFNNAISNLRLASYSENARNQKVRAGHPTGTMGVHWNKVKQRWQANISVNGKRVNLGRYKTFEEAVAARREGEVVYFGEFRVQLF
jgi:hypothetical protein